MLSLDRQEALRRRYAAMRPRWRASTHVYQHLVTSFLTDETTVLDVGCGRGGVLERVGSTARLAVGLDPDLASLQENRFCALPILAGMAERLPFPSCSFDLVLCSWVLEHLADPCAALGEFSRALRSGGRLVFLTPNVRSPLVGLNRLARGMQSTIVPLLYDRPDADTFPVVYRANTRRRIDRLARRVGLTREAILTVGDPTYVAFTEGLFWLSRVLQRLTPSALRVHLVGQYVKR